jgi:hypothetical protein
MGTEGSTNIWVVPCEAHHVASGSQEDCGVPESEMAED